MGQGAQRDAEKVGGFLAVTAERRNGTPTLQIRHYNVDGEILNEDIRVLQ